MGGMERRGGGVLSETEMLAACMTNVRSTYYWYVIATGVRFTVEHFGIATPVPLYDN